VKSSLAKTPTLETPSTPLSQVLRGGVLFLPKSSRLAWNSSACSTCWRLGGGLSASLATPSLGPWYAWRPPGAILAWWFVGIEVVVSIRPPLLMVAAHSLFAPSRRHSPACRLQVGMQLRIGCEPRGARPRAEAQRPLSLSLLHATFPLAGPKTSALKGREATLQK
jgi:hypothetical protein